MHVRSRLNRTIYWLIRVTGNMFQVLILVSTILVGVGGDNNNIRVCDSTLSDSSPPGIYTNYIKSLYQQRLSDISLDMPTDCDQFEAANVGVWWVNPVTGVLAATGVIDSDIGGKKANCAKIKNNIENSKKGIGLTVAWPIEYLIKTLSETNGIASEIYTKYTEQVLSLKYNTYTQAQLHDFVTKSGGVTVWTSVTLTRPNGYDVSPWCVYDETKPIPSGSKVCIHPFYRISDQLFDKPITFSGTGFNNMDGYIQFNKNLYTGTNKKIVQVRDSEGQLRWGVSVPGCSPPTFEVKVVWETQEKKGCNKPLITVTSIRETENFVCKMDFTTNILRNYIKQDITSNMQARAKTMLQQKFFTMDKNNVILISNSHAMAISKCIFSEQNIPSKWDAWSESAPGKCVACTSSGAGNFISRINRACDLTSALDRNKDCCFDCAKGYNMLVYTDAMGLKQETCTKACMKGYAYDNEQSLNPRCVQCPAGKYTSITTRGCFTCVQLGVYNAVVINKKGCVPCGSRAAASKSGTECIPCQAQEYVPVNASICKSCPDGSRLLAADSKVCTPCSPGYKFRDNTCVLCEMNSFKTNSGSGECTRCPFATRALPNRTACIPCNTLNRTIAPLAIYKPNGASCDVMCNLSISHAHGSNPYTSDGCRLCSDSPPPIGAYPVQDDCIKYLPCTNAPSSNKTIVEYTGFGKMGDSSSCTWACKSGFKKSGSYCVACDSAGFNASIHVYYQECLFNCIPGIYYRGIANCKVKCTTDLKISLRLWDYYRFFLNGSKTYNKLPESWPNYIMNQCGSDEKDPSSEIPLLRNVGIYGYLSPSSSGTCGNYILNNNEECDDGNVVNDDGCSTQCKIERNEFWDCNVIGEKCKALCGWELIPSDSWGIGLMGYKFDPRTAIQNDVPWCTGITYNDALQIPLASRSQWMRENLVSCECDSNPMQTLPYAECNYTNRGCRQCLPNNYKDDLYARCTHCGSTCGLGFRSFDASIDNIPNAINAAIKARYDFASTLQQCGPEVSTSQTLTYADPVDNPKGFGRDQIFIGCVPCSLTGSNTIDKVVFVQGDDSRTCNWICKRDPANQTDPDYYCESSNSRICNGPCIPCDTSLQLKTQSLNGQVGKYLKACSDNEGHAIGDCDSLDHIPNAHYTGNSVQVVADKGGCTWECNAGYQRLSETCVPCSPSLSIVCKNGEMIVACNNGGGYHCAPCVLMKGVAALEPMQIWKSLPDFSDCVPDCEDGLSFRNISQNSEKCQKCTQQTCALNERFIQCITSQDSSCEPCRNIVADELQATHREFFNPGTCELRCSKGYALNNDLGECVECARSVDCEPGYHPEHNCLEDTERSKVPDCVRCNVDTRYNIYTAARNWVSGCATACINGWMFDSVGVNYTCIPCQIQLCGEGMGANCANGILNCYACPLSISELNSKQMKYSGHGNCSAVCISAEYILPSPDSDYCVLASDLTQTNNNPGPLPDSNTPIEVEQYGVDLLSPDVIAVGANISYPTRMMSHSAYDPVQK